MATQLEQAVQLAGKVFKKAGADPAFRALAMRDGTAAVEQVLGSKLPDGMKIRFVENEGAWLTLGMPPARTSDELSDRELEAVAGGKSGTETISTGGDFALIVAVIPPR